MNGWQDQLATETRGFRHWMAEGHRYEATRADHERKLGRREGRIALECRGGAPGPKVAKIDGKPCGMCAGCLKRKARWHRDRAKGHEQRFERVKTCGEDEIGKVNCEACGCEHGAPHRSCEVWRVCVACRDHAASERKVRFGLARYELIVEARKRGAFRHLQLGGRWSERHITLTIPHVSARDLGHPVTEVVRGKVQTRQTLPTRFVGLSGDELTLALRVETLFAAWRHFSRRWQRHWRQQKKAGKLHGSTVRLYRAFEWTVGDDLLGHPHFHVWAWSKWIDDELVQEWWAEALRDAGMRLAPDAYVRIDVRKIKTRPERFSAELFKGGKKQAIKLARLESEGRGGEDVISYADGWSLAEIAKDGQRISPRMMAVLYEALEGRHVAHASRGLLPEHELAACSECGTVGALRFVVDHKKREIHVAKAFDRGTPPAFANSA